MTVLFLPDYSGGNPYQANLAAALEEDVTFVDEGTGFSILRAVRSVDDVSVIHFHWLSSYVYAGSAPKTAVRLTLTVVQLLVVRLLGIPVVWTAHNVITHESRYRWLERWFKHAFLRYGFCRAVFVHCAAVQDTLIEEFGLPEDVAERVYTIPHGHYLDSYENDISREAARTALGFGSEETVLLYFGQIRPYKGVPALIDAFGSIEAPDYRLLIVGTPRDDTLEDTIRTKSAGDERVRTILEFVPDEEIQRYMNAADAVVLPYEKVTTSGSAILAMSFGRAVVVPALGCLPELLDERGAIVYRPTGGGGETTGLRAALERTRDRDLAAMGRFNEEHVARYDWARIAEATARIYDEVR